MYCTVSCAQREVIPGEETLREYWYLSEGGPLCTKQAASTVYSVLRPDAVQNILCWPACSVHNGPPSPSNLSQPAQADGGQGRRSIYTESLVAHIGRKWKTVRMFSKWKLDTWPLLQIKIGHSNSKQVLFSTKQTSNIEHMKLRKSNNMRTLSMRIVTRRILRQRITIENSNILANFRIKSKSLEILILWPN